MATSAPTPVRKFRTGVVTSDRMQKTIVVRIDRLVQHKEYGRVLRGAVSFKAHDEKQEAHVGDTVRIVETRPLSKEKRWRLVEILTRAPRRVTEDLVDPLAAEAPQPATGAPGQAA